MVTKPFCILKGSNFGATKIGQDLSTLLSCLSLITRLSSATETYRPYADPGCVPDGRRRSKALRTQQIDAALFWAKIGYPTLKNHPKSHIEHQWTSCPAHWTGCISLQIIFMGSHHILTKRLVSYPLCHEATMNQWNRQETATKVSTDGLDRHGYFCGESDELWRSCYA